MKLDYKILWLDDKMDDILRDQYDDEIKYHLIEQGFEPIIITVKNEIDFFKNLDDTFDLILTDYHLNDTTNNTRDGDLIIKEVRERNSIFTEIMFYSAQGEVVDTVKLDRITFVDTRKSTIRNHNEAVIDRAIKLIDLTIKKFQHIVAMRGMIMNETSSLDVEMMELLISLINQKGEENVIPVIKNKYKETNNQFNENIEEITDISIILQKIGSEHRWRAIVRNLEKGDIKNIFSHYKNEIIDERNRFAHAVLEESEDGRKYFRHKEFGIDFNVDKCKEIRINILKHKSNIAALKKKLNA
ncbi:MAG TPA: hypothetical protein PK622_10095 [Saprospiraceae bacterium]|nr:response regulator transcription factor [Saprospiraceae bacterium]MBK7697436.1 response regulator transcription factor [Saprospiraceae bacterium]MBK8826013.1 response regulator transcription factor [Saprospiraceae bacterium]MBK9582685.1 response regulator transcription factor [Saprospiraceae bacterium]HUN17155.1 hypothetical protein [Saprospiraceae bacterium]